MVPAVAESHIYIYVAIVGGVLGIIAVLVRAAIASIRVAWRFVSATERNTEALERMSERLTALENRVMRRA